MWLDGRVERVLGAEVLDEKQLEKKGFGGIISVGKGSQRPPRLVRLTWAPKKAKTATDVRSSTRSCSFCAFLLCW